MADPIRSKPFPLAIYPVMAAHLVAIVGIVVWLGNCSESGTINGDTVGNHVGNISQFSERFVQYSKMENFKLNHKSVWVAMQKETSFNAAQRDCFGGLNAIIGKDEGKLLELTEKYTKVDFLPAYLLGANPAAVKEMVAYAKDNGPAQAISRLMKDADQSDGCRTTRHRKRF